MGSQDDIDLFIEHVSSLKDPYKFLSKFFIHSIICILLIVIFWWATSISFIAALPTILIISSISNIPFINIAENYFKIREKYIKNYPKNTWQILWNRYSYTSPFGCAALYAPLLLINYEFLPFRIISTPENLITNPLFPIFIALPLGIFIILLGMLLTKHARNHDSDIDIFLNIIDPDKYNIMTDGIYQYIRHPTFLGRLTLSIGFGVIANNVLAILVAVFHFLPYYACMIFEDKNFLKRYRKELYNYYNTTPALFPRSRNLKNFFKIIFSKREVD